MRSPHQLLRMLLLLVCLPWVVAAPAVASSPASPCVRFDVDSAVPCADVTPPEWQASHSGEKLVRVRFQISSLITLGREDALLQYLYVVTSASRPFHVVDISPQTELASDVTGKLVVDKQTDQNVSANFKAVLPPSLWSSGDFSAGYNDVEHQTLHYEKLPEKHLIAASGTVERGAGAYFKLKPSTQTTLEGDRTFEILARVPHSWRGGLLYVRCAAYGEPRGLTSSQDDRDLICGANAFWVGLFLAGDQEAQQRVADFYASRDKLQRSAGRLAQEIESQRYPSLGHKLGAALTVVQPRIPRDWLDRVLVSAELPDFTPKLPKQVQTLAQDYQLARSELAALSR